MISVRNEIMFAVSRTVSPWAICDFSSSRSETPSPSAFAAEADNLQECAPLFAAIEALARGEGASVIHLLLSPALRFVKFYFFRLGLLDGLPGLVHILVGCGASFAKYAKMLAFQRKTQ